MSRLSFYVSKNPENPWIYNQKWRKEWEEKHLTEKLPLNKIPEIINHFKILFSELLRLSPHSSDEITLYQKQFSGEPREEKLAQLYQILSKKLDWLRREIVFKLERNPNEE